MIINLDQNFNPYPHLTEIEFEAFTFSGGEPHIQIKSDLSNVNEVFISHRITSFDDIGLLLLTVNALRNLKVEHLHLFLPYFPAARQDRVMTKGEPLSVKVYADLINQQCFKSVTIVDPHSDVTPALLNNCIVINNHHFIKLVTQQLPKDLILISPDGGALKKIYKLAKELKEYDVVECSKSRNISTGKLTHFKVYAEDLEKKACLIVDDICDGGGTFLGLAKELKAKNAGNLYLAISHGIFSKGTKELEQHFDKIFTTDAFSTIQETANVEQITISKLIK